MDIKYDNTATRKAKAFTTADFTFSVNAVDVNTPIGAGSNPQSSTVNDAVLITSPGAGILHEWQMQCDLEQAYTFESATPEVATVDATGKVTHVADGLATVMARTPRLTRCISKDVSRVTGSPWTTLDHYTAGTLAAACGAQVDTRIAGKSVGGAQAIYASRDDGYPAYVRNANCWCADVDLTCMSVWNSHLPDEGQPPYTGRMMGGTLITPRHIVFAHHYSLLAHDTLRFVTNGDVMVQAELAGVAYVPNTDIAIGVLSADVPNTIRFAKLLPGDVAHYLPSVGYGVAALAVDADKNAMVDEVCQVLGYSNFRPPVAAKRAEFYGELVGGDSGSPSFLLIDLGQGVELVLITVWTAGGAGGGASYSDNLAAINAAIVALGNSGGYTVTVADLSGFTRYN